MCKNYISVALCPGDTCNANEPFGTATLPQSERKCVAAGIGKFSLAWVGKTCE